MSPKEPSPDHDQRFKTLLVEFFHEFLALFFPTWAAAWTCPSSIGCRKKCFPSHRFRS